MYNNFILYFLGTATIDFVLNANFYIQATNNQVGTIEIASTIDFLVRTASKSFL